AFKAVAGISGSLGALVLVDWILAVSNVGFSVGGIPFGAHGDLSPAVSHGWLIASLSSLAFARLCALVDGLLDRGVDAEPAELTCAHWARRSDAADRKALGLTY